MIPEVVLSFVNETPEKFKSTSRFITKIEGEKAIISKDMKGHLIVSYDGEIYELYWFQKIKKWVEAMTSALSR